MISLRKKIGYGLGDVGLSISYFTIAFFFLYYLTDIVGLQPYLAGLAFFIGQAWDSINDPPIGAISDRTVSRYGRKRVYMLFGALPFALSFILLWMIPLNGSQALKFWFATVSMLLFTTIYSMIETPYMALVPVMTGDYDERTNITGIRSMLSTLGTLLGGGAAMLVSNAESELTGLRTMAFGFAVGLFITTLIAAQSVRGMEPYDRSAAFNTSGGWRRFLDLLHDRNVLILLLFKFLGAVATGSLMASLPYFAKHILGDEGKSTIGLAFYITIAAVSIPFWDRLARRHDKRRLLFMAMLGMLIILLPFGLFVTKHAPWIFYIGCSLLGFVMSAYMLIAYSLPPDLVDYNDDRTGERPESIIFGLWLTSHQFGVAVAGLLVGMILQVTGYDGTRVEQTSEALLAVRLTLGFIPGTAMLLAVTVLQRYSITRNIYQEIQKALQERNLAGKEFSRSNV